MPAVDWYFDFISPFAYLQCERLDRLPANARLRPRPILFAGLLNHHGQKGPAEIDGKRAFTYRFVMWQAQRQGTKVRLPPEHPFNPLPLLRLAVAADGRPEIVREIFRFIWRDGRLADNPIEWAELVDTLDLREPATLVDTPEVKNRLRANTEEAIARGVFGVPTLAIGEELFWGNDATDMAIAFLGGDPLFASPAYRNAGSVPVGAKRR
jgi:2-hydroxychromene-2-carboxylate isomerase